MKLIKNERGFTLIEIMVVLIIIGILAAIAIPTMSKQSDKAKVKRAVAEIKSMGTIIDIYMGDAVADPASTAPTAAATGVGKVLKDMGVTNITDPWNNKYLYKIDATDTSNRTYILYSNGNLKVDNDAITHIGSTSGAAAANTIAENAAEITGGTELALP